MYNQSNPVVYHSQIPHEYGILRSLLERLYILIHFFDLVYIMLEQAECIEERMHENLGVLVLPY